MPNLMGPVRLGVSIATALDIPPRMMVPTLGALAASAVQAADLDLEEHLLAQRVEIRHRRTDRS